MKDKKYIWYREFKDKYDNDMVIVLNRISEKPTHMSERNFNKSGGLNKEFHLTEEEARKSPYFELMFKKEIRTPKEDKMYHVKLKNEFPTKNDYLNVEVATENFFFHDNDEDVHYKTIFTYKEALNWVNDNKMLEMIKIIK